MTTVFNGEAQPARRQFLRTAAASAVASFPPYSLAQSADVPERQFAPQPGAWRTFEVSTRVEIAAPRGQTRVWVPVPSVDTAWQKSLESAMSSNGKVRMLADGREGARMAYAEFDAAQMQPFVEVTSRIQTQNRLQDWKQKSVPAETAASLAQWTRATKLIPVDGIVLSTASEATKGARNDVEKAQKIFDWIVSNTYREPKVRGCGEGDIQTMLETGNLGGKCADLNALFVGLCRSVGLPARDVYGLRVAPSAFGYKELGGISAKLQGAQHCRAEVYLQGYGWVAMDPADVAKVMRQETAQWIKDPRNPVVAPVNRVLFGGWEGNWMAYNTAHDVVLPNAQGPRLGFLMYPHAETGGQGLDAYAPDDFRYRISAKEITA
jgi:transglutaminase-like putative cysteine protease